MTHRLSFAVINSLSKDLLELIIDKINDYKYSFEAKLLLGSSPLIQAVAILNYYTSGASDTKNIERIRESDKLNMKMFSGLELDRDQAIDWLTTELSVTAQNV